MLASRVVGLFLLLAVSLSCGGPADSPPGSSADGLPELTDELIRERLVGVRVFEIPEEAGEKGPISWRFFENEPKEIIVVEKKVEGTRATVVLDIKTQSGPRTRDPLYLAGQIRTEWELRTGMVLRRWEIAGTENISMKFRTLPKPPQNATP